jgi:hypothetical protein
MFDVASGSRSCWAQIEANSTSCRSRSASAAASSADGEEPARVLPERAGEGHPEGARRGRGFGADLERSRRRSRPPACPRSAEEGRGELKKLKLMSPMSAEATVVRNYIDWLVNLPWKKKSKISNDLAAPRRSSTRTTTASRRSRSASSSTSRCSSASTSSRRRSCAWSAPRASARPRSASRSRAPPTASSCAWRWAACATRPRSAATAAPTSARCRARSCRT